MPHLALHCTDKHRYTLTVWLVVRAWLVMMCHCLLMRTRSTLLCTQRTHLYHALPCSALPYLAPCQAQALSMQSHPCVLHATPQRTCHLCAFVAFADASLRYPTSAVSWLSPGYLRVGATNMSTRGCVGFKSRGRRPRAQHTPHTPQQHSITHNMMSPHPNQTMACAKVLRARSWPKFCFSFL